MIQELERALAIIYEALILNNPGPVKMPVISMYLHSYDYHRTLDTLFQEVQPGNLYTPTIFNDKESIKLNTKWGTIIFYKENEQPKFTDFKKLF